jgi:hypothetical protein
MTPASESQNPVHTALDLVAQACIEEKLLEQADDLHQFLDLTGMAPRTAALLQVWICSQRGHPLEALQSCNALVEIEPDSLEILTLLAVLSYSCGDAGWRAISDKLLDTSGLNPDCRQIAASLRDGSLGRTKPGDAAHGITAESDRATMAVSTVGVFVDCTGGANFMRG